MPGINRLVVTFDAFGTLFTPREPIARSYARYARRYGLSGFTEEEISVAFREAFKEESIKAPNYGKRIGMEAPQWWSNVIHSTFRAFTSSTPLPKQLVPCLLNRFSSSKGYRLYPDVVPIFRLLRQAKDAARKEPGAKAVSVGVITNSDSRIPSILSSLGLSIATLRERMGEKKRVYLVSQKADVTDVDFVALSYDIGSEKPSREIFKAAERLAGPGSMNENPTKYIHVGDDLDKDFYGAEQAGWKGVLLDRDRQHSAKSGMTLITNLLELKSYIVKDRLES